MERAPNKQHEFSTTCNCYHGPLFLCFQFSPESATLQSSQLDKQAHIHNKLSKTHDDDLDLEIRQVPVKGRGIFRARAYAKGELMSQYARVVISGKEGRRMENE